MDTYNVSYFEFVLKRGGASVGLVALQRDNNNHHHGQTIHVGPRSHQHVGWQPISYGFHSDDGHFFWHDGSPGVPFGGQCAAFGPAWSTNDSNQPSTVGCGLDLDSGQIFFTLAGELMNDDKELPQVERGEVYAAAVSLHERGDHGEINFGTQAFCFDIESYMTKRNDSL